MEQPDHKITNKFHKKKPFETHQNYGLMQKMAENQHTCIRLGGFYIGFY